MADRGQLRAEIRKKCIFYHFRAFVSKTSECLWKGKVGIESVVNQY